MSILNILYQSNDYYGPITGVSMTSLMENNKDIDFINFFVLDDKISDENKQKMETVCKQYGRPITFVNTDKILKTLKDLKVAPFKGTYTTYFKLFALNDLPVENSRILQLDGDTIVDGSLKGLCDTDLKGYVCAATYDCTMNSYKQMIDIPLTDKYYNCGVLLVNQNEWRNYKCQDKIVEHLSKVRNGYYTVDQDIINVLFRDRIKYLSLTYNFNSGFYIYGIKESLKMYDLKPEYYSTYEEIEKVMKSPKLIHCMGAMTGRPWEQDSIHPQNKIFDHYRALSPWKNHEKVKVKRKLIFKIQRALYQMLPRALYIPLHRIGQRHYLSNMNQSVQKASRN
ncbi:MAG: glycosyl transferase, family 8 [Microgenomates group bacterium GW2011_GWA2_44_7]|nr:MAG: glycosyl transferase, family 8 [Microgenomates group bacterium GW2011_GWA2_44_7]